ncbi:LuxO repressor protein [Beggiatoa sp. PS]|nr:LuxO repressor protein [Beggiatoa sp. PS]
MLHEGKEVTSKMLPAPLNRKLSSKMTNSTNTLQKNMMIPTGVINSSSHSKEEMPSKAVSLKPDTIRPLWEVEKDAIEKAIEFCEGSVSKAAALLDVSPSTLYRKRQGWET